MTEHNEYHAFKADEIPSQEISDPAVLSKAPLVSVNIITYNHEPYIAQAIEGALMQKTNFPYEVLIGEDDSSDGTREICKEYAARYPAKIRLFLNDRKNVIYINGRPTGRWNFVNLLRNARGQYMAICEGDDYWIDPYKLQKQVDFLEKNKDYGIVHTDAHWLFNKTGKIIQNWHRYYNHLIPQGDIYEKLIEANIIFTCTVCVRKCFIERFGLKDNFCDQNFLMGDYPRWLYISRKSKIGYLDFASATRRLMEESATQSKDLQKKWELILSGYDTRKKFMEKYPVSPELEKQILIRFNQTKLFYAFRLMNIGMAKDAYRYLSCNNSIFATDILKYLLNRFLSKLKGVQRAPSGKRAPTRKST